MKAKGDKDATADPDQRSAERVKIKQGLDEARHVFERGGDLPAYLEKALIRYEAVFWAGVEKRLIIPKLVKRAHDKGMPLSKKSRKRLCNLFSVNFRVGGHDVRVTG